MEQQKAEDAKDLLLGGLGARKPSFWGSEEIFKWIRSTYIHIYITAMNRYVHLYIRIPSQQGRQVFGLASPAEASASEAQGVLAGR